jgi:hypothetical protein
MPETFQRTLFDTYRTLRVAMVPLLLMLVVSTGLESTRGQDCLLGSISAYFHTPVRGAFVFSLAALGACLIAYKGNDAVENVLLDFAGFMAWLVALVPTTVDDSCPGKYAGLVADANTADAVRNNVLSLVTVSVVFLVLYRLMPRQGRAAATAAGGQRRTARVLGTLCGAVVLAQLGMFVFWPSTFKDVAHGISASTMVLGVLGVMVANAVGFARAEQRTHGEGAGRPWRNRYGATAAATLVILVATLAWLPWRSHLILAAELVVVTGFGLFWLMQTHELCAFATRDQKTRAVVAQGQDASAPRPVEPPPVAPDAVVAGRGASVTP